MIGLLLDFLFLRSEKILDNGRIVLVGKRALFAVGRWVRNLGVDG